MFKKLSILGLGLLATTGMASAQVGVNVGLPLPNGGYVTIGSNSGYQTYPYVVPNQVPVYQTPVYANSYPAPVVVQRPVRARVRNYVPVKYKPVYGNYRAQNRNQHSYGCR
jgi:hypothetical protein